MPRLEPFVALRYDTDLAGPLDTLVAPPYDVISADEASRLLARSPHNVVRLEGSTVECSDGDHRRAAELLATWRAEGILAPMGPAAFAYEMRFELEGRPRTTRGMLAALEIEPWGQGVLPHEHVSRRPLGERLGRLREMRANVSPIHVVVPGPSPRFSSALAEAAASPPVGDVTDEDGVRHRLWAIDLDRALQDELAGQSCMIADGHHRYTTALAYRDEMRASHGAGPWDHVLAFVADADGSPVLPFHRVVVRGAPLPRPDLRTASLQETLDAVDDDRVRVGVILAADGGAAEYGVVDLAAPPPAVEAVEPLLPSDEDSVRYVPDAREANAMVRSGAATGAWLLPPTTAERIRSAVDAGRRLPRKSTYFWPKPRTGFVLRPFD